MILRLLFSGTPTPDGTMVQQQVGEGVGEGEDEEEEEGSDEESDEEDDYGIVTVDSFVTVDFSDED